MCLVRWSILSTVDKVSISNALNLPTKRVSRDARWSTICSYDTKPLRCVQKYTPLQIGEASAGPWVVHALPAILAVEPFLPFPCLSLVFVVFSYGEVLFLYILF